MGCGATKEQKQEWAQQIGKHVGGALQKAQELQTGKKKKEPEEIPLAAVGDLIILLSYGVIGTVTEVEEAPRKGVCGQVKVTEIGMEARSAKFDCEKWSKVEDVPELKPFAPSMQVTTEFRGSKVNGWIKDMDKRTGELIVKFLPDEAHDKVDKSHWTLGSTTRAKPEDCTAGHSGDERPRNRSAEEIEAEKQKVKSYGVAYIHCNKCGKGVWEDPCDCYVTKPLGWACGQCGKKASSDMVVCCGKKIKDNAQNQGWANVLGRQYGYF